MKNKSSPEPNWLRERLGRPFATLQGFICKGRQYADLNTSRKPGQVPIRRRDRTTRNSHIVGERTGDVRPLPAKYSLRSGEKQGWRQ